MKLTVSCCAEQVRMLHGQLMITVAECGWQMDQHRVWPQVRTGLG